MDAPDAEICQQVPVTEPNAVEMIVFTEISVGRIDDMIEITLYRATTNPITRAIEMQVAGRCTCTMGTFMRILAREARRWLTGAMLRLFPEAMPQ